jgi:hypothetical protein
MSGNAPSRKSSGLSTHRTGAPTPTAPTEADMYNMPLEKLRELANKQLAERQ